MNTSVLFFEDLLSSSFTVLITEDVKQIIRMIDIYEEIVGRKITPSDDLWHVIKTRMNEIFNLNIEKIIHVLIIYQRLKIDISEEVISDFITFAFIYKSNIIVLVRNIILYIDKKSTIYLFLISFMISAISANFISVSTPLTFSGDLLFFTG